MVKAQALGISGGSQSLSQNPFESMIARADRAADALPQCDRILRTSRHRLQSFLIRVTTPINFLCSCRSNITSPSYRTCSPVKHVHLSGPLAFLGWSIYRNMPPINRGVEAWMPVFRNRQSQFGILPVNNFYDFIIVLLPGSLLRTLANSIRCRQMT